MPLESKGRSDMDRPQARIKGRGTLDNPQGRFETLARSLPKRSLPAFHWERLRRGEFGARIVLEGK